MPIPFNLTTLTQFLKDHPAVVVYPFSVMRWFVRCECRSGYEPAQLHFRDEVGNPSWVVIGLADELICNPNGFTIEKDGHLIRM